MAQTVQPHRALELTGIKPSTTTPWLLPIATEIPFKAPTPNVAISITGMPLQPELALMLLALVAPMFQGLSVRLVGDCQVPPVTAHLLLQAVLV